ncbi:MAG: S-layer homology domain-containing protein, partial [Armatimonadota bacterium]
MKKAIIGSLTAAVLVMAAPSFAQGPFADVPVDHWSYEAVSQLQEKGVVIGYPDGTFSGKRAMTRYEFALALSRAAPVIADMVKNVTDLSNYYTKADVYTKAETDAKFSTKAETDEKLAALNTAIMAKMDKAIEEFKSELAQMGVDIDALKRDVASLEERVAALEAEHKRLKITSKMTFFALGSSTDEGAFVDRDNRDVANTNNLLENVSVVRDADVIMSYEASGAKAKIVLNAGNYLNYLGKTVTNFTGIRRPDSSPDNTDNVSLFMAYGEVPLLGAAVTVGRFPIQFTKWTLKKFDVDEYTENWKTDDGNYYVDGGKVAWNWGSVDLLAYAGKNNTNSNMFNYVSNPAGGPFLSALPTVGIGRVITPVQSAGVRAVFGVAGAKVGLNYINSGSTSGELYDEAQIWGADVDYNIGSWKWGGAYTKSDSSGRGAVPD